MSQQAFDLPKTVQELLHDNWTLEDQLEKTKFKWYAWKPTLTEIQNEPMSIVVTYEAGTGDSVSKAVAQIRDQIKIDVYMSLRNLEGDDTRATLEANRMLVKDMILQIIHDNQTAISNVKFGKYVRSARNDEVEENDEQWFLHEILFIQAEWYHTES